MKGGGSVFTINAANSSCSTHHSSLNSRGVAVNPARARKMIICHSFVRDSTSLESLRNDSSSRGTSDMLLSAAGAAENEDSAGAAEMGLTDTPLNSTLEHHLWTLAGCSSFAGMLIKSAAAAAGSQHPVESLAVCSFSAYVVADLATGIYHWAVDNYGDATTPVFGPQIDGFQGHHKRPWTITRREFSNNIHALARPAAIFLLPVLLFTPGDAAVDSFLGMFLGFVVFSQQFHAWAHLKRGEVPKVVAALQELGLLVSPRAHGQHHRAPFSCNYCIVSGMWNGLLDESQVLKMLERFIFLNWGYAPRCWEDSPNP